MNVKPLADRVIIRPLEAETKTSGGIIIPDSAMQKPQKGEVVAAGPGKFDESGKIIALYDPEHLELEPPVRSLRARLLKEGRHGDRKAVFAITAGMFSRYPVEPALPPAGDGKIRRIDGKKTAVFHHAPVEPVGDGEREPPALLGL